jgi:hypothetical protein
VYRRLSIKQVNWICVSLLLVASSQLVMAQSAIVAPARRNSDTATLDAEREKQALRVLLKSVGDRIESAARVMPADKYGFAPTEGEFKGVRTFGRQVKHLAATNYMLAAAALGEQPPADAGDERLDPKR